MLHHSIENSEADDNAPQCEPPISVFFLRNPEKKTIKGLVPWFSAACSHALSWTGIDPLRNEEEENQ